MPRRAKPLNEFGRNLHAVLRRRKMSLHAAAKGAGLEYMTVHRWATGDWKPRSDLLEKLCAFLCVQPAALVLGLPRLNGVLLTPEELDWVQATLRIPAERCEALQAVVRVLGG